jgi:ethanolamine ammonia-lyase small subunit
MTDNKSSPDRVTPDGDLWTQLRRLTDARIGLPRSGASLATAPLLDFRLAHARARDAVHAGLDDAALTEALEPFHLPVLTLASAASDKQTYLMRPDLGRTLATGAEATLEPYAGAYDIVFVVSDGLSAHAVQRHAAPLLATVLPALAEQGQRIAPLVIAIRGRVALGDIIAHRLRADCVAVLIGERPGLSAPDSMGAYVTWRPDDRTSDAGRNCISNIRRDGIGYADAGFKFLHLLQAMRIRRLSGVQLKDTSDRLAIGGQLKETDQL